LSIHAYFAGLAFGPLGLAFSAVTDHSRTSEDGCTRGLGPGVGGEYTATEFNELAGGGEPERHGPYETYEAARRAWSALSMKWVDSAFVKYEIERGGGEEYWVVGGRYTDTTFSEIADGAEEERVGPFRLLTRGFTPEGGELTPKLSLRRSVVAEHFAREIEGLFAGESARPVSAAPSSR